MNPGGSPRQPARTAGNLPALRASAFFAGALVLAACGQSPQQAAYEQAAKKEPQLTLESLPAIVDEYQQVIRLDPGSAWAKKAQARIDAAKSRLSADELHQSVFQEHGVD